MHNVVSGGGDVLVVKLLTVELSTDCVAKLIGFPCGGPFAYSATSVTELALPCRRRVAADNDAKRDGAADSKIKHSFHITSTPVVVSSDTFASPPPPPPPPPPPIPNLLSHSATYHAARTQSTPTFSGVVESPTTFEERSGMFAVQEEEVEVVSTVGGGFFPHDCQES